jgi:hypothetical protein
MLFMWHGLPVHVPSAKCRCRIQMLRLAETPYNSRNGEFCPREPYLFFKDLNDYEVEIAFELPTPVDPKPAE